VHILHIGNRIPFPLTDGGAICSYKTLEFLHKAGHRITGCFLNTKKHWQPPEVMLAVCDTVHTVDVDTTIRMHKAARNLLSWKPYIAERFFSPAFEQLLADVLEDSSFDVVLIDHTMTAWYVDVVRTILHRQAQTQERAQERTIPIVLRTHNVEYLIQQRLAANESHPFKRWYRRQLARRLQDYERRYYSRFDAVIAITPQDKALIDELLQPAAQQQRATVEHHTETTTTVIPAGVDSSMFAPNPAIQPRPYTISYIGGMDWLPNIEATIWFIEQVMPLVRARLPRCEFHVAGKQMPEHIHNYGSDPRHPNVFTYSDVPSAAEFMQSYQITVVPLLSGGGMRLKVVEAMALGLPIVSTRVGAEGIALTHGESVLYADTPEEFVEALVLLFENPTLAQSLGARARSIALAQYTWEGVTAQLTAFLEHMRHYLLLL
jgi:glycosyltransferase involved in cell wall biosynthesis